jgi:hypothetical protein
MRAANECGNDAIVNALRQASASIIERTGGAASACRRSASLKELRGCTMTMPWHVRRRLLLRLHGHVREVLAY